MRFAVRAAIAAGVVCLLLLIFHANVDWTGRESLGKFGGGLNALMGGSSGVYDYRGWDVCPSDGGPDNDHFLLSSSEPIRGGKYFELDFGERFVTNPNIIPHPHKDNTFVIIGQEVSDGSWMDTYGCEAEWRMDGKLACITSPQSLPIRDTDSKKCYNYPMLNSVKGAHDMRLFYGPDAPYVIYGSQSQFACFGLMIQDFRSLWYLGSPATGDFVNDTELQRPKPWGEIEKNWFVMWTRDGRRIVHHDIWPERVFAELNGDGTVGKAISRRAKHDFECLETFLPEVAPENESIHQSTNTLQVTLCRRGQCEPTDDNTVIISIYQYKTYYHYHALYEPYVMVMNSVAPYELVGLSSKPFWINGRGKTTKPQWAEFGDSAMFYVVSIGWKSVTQKYHGFLDDELFVNFGIEDSTAGSIDVRASDLLRCIKKCPQS